VNVDSVKTLTIADSGYVQNVIADDVDITLPATATQGVWTIRNAGVKSTGGAEGTVSDGTALVRVSPNASDRIQGGVAGTAVDNKELQNTKATSRVGDEVTIKNTGETNGPIVAAIRGIWAREA
jgi:hypothetical protein